MLLIILAVGAVIAIASVVMSYLELIPFFKAVQQLNRYTKSNPTFKNHFLYAFRFASLLRLALPVVVDIGISALCAAMGLAGGVVGCMIALIISFAVSCAIKIHRHWIAPKLAVSSETWQVI